MSTPNLIYYALNKYRKLYTKLFGLVVFAVSNCLCCRKLEIFDSNFEIGNYRSLFPRFNGPFAVLLTYIAELHRTEYRARVILLTSLFYTFANITLPLLAWSLLTRDINVYLFGQKFGEF